MPWAAKLDQDVGIYSGAHLSLSPRWGLNYPLDSGGHRVHDVPSLRWAKGAGPGTEMPNTRHTLERHFVLGPGDATLVKVMAKLQGQGHFCSWPGPGSIPSPVLLVHPFRDRIRCDTYTHLPELPWEYLRSPVPVFKKGGRPLSPMMDSEIFRPEESENRVSGGKARIPNIAQIPAPLRGVLLPNFDMEVTILSRKQ